MMKLKPLPRDEVTGAFTKTFQANGNTYVVLNPNEDGMTFHRINMYQKLSVSAAYNVNFQEHANNIAEIKRIAEDLAAGKQRFVDLAVHANNMQQGIVEAAKHPNAQAFYFCTLFIVREGSDLREWTFEQADEWIKDWQEEGYNANDFLAFALTSIPGYREYLKNLTK